MRFLLVATGLFALVALASGAAASTTPPATGDWTIGSSEVAVLSGGSTVVQGSVLVAGTLSVENATLELAPPSCNATATLQLSPGAVLRLDNATLRAPWPCRFVLTADPGATVAATLSTLEGLGTVSAFQVSGVGVLLRGSAATFDRVDLVNSSGGIGLQQGASLSGTELSVRVGARALYLAGGSSASLSGFVAEGNTSSTDYLLIVEGSTLLVDGGNISLASVGVLTLSSAAEFRDVGLGPDVGVGVLSLSSTITWHGGAVAPRARPPLRPDPRGFEAYGSTLDIETHFYNVTFGLVVIETALKVSNSTFNGSGEFPKGTSAIVYGRDSDVAIANSWFNGTYWVTDVPRLINNTTVDVPVYACGTSGVWAVRTTVSVNATRTECFEKHYDLEDSAFRADGLILSNGTEGLYFVGGTMDVANVSGELFEGPSGVLLTAFEASGRVDGMWSVGNSIGIELRDSQVHVDRFHYQSPGLGVRVVSGNPTVNGSTFVVHNETGVEVLAGSPVVSNSTFQLSSYLLNATGVFVKGGRPLIESNVFAGDSSVFLTFGVWTWAGTTPTVRGNQFVDLDRAAVMYGRDFLLEANRVENCNVGFESRDESFGTIVGNTFANLSATFGYGVRVYFAATLVASNTFTNLKYGVQVNQYTTSVAGETRIADNTFSDVDFYAIELVNSSRPVLVDNNTVRGAVRGAVELLRAPAIGSYNLFVDIDGAGYSVGDSDLVVIGDRFENVWRGIDALRGNLRVDYATFSRNQVGILAQYSPTTVHNSSFQSNSIAVNLPNDAVNEVHDSLFLSNGDAVLAFYSAQVDIRDSSFLRTLSRVVSCEDNSTATISFSRRGEISGGVVGLRGSLVSSAPFLRLSQVQFRFEPLAAGVPGIDIAGASELSLEGIDVGNRSVPYSFALADSAGTLTDSRFTAPSPSVNGSSAALSFVRTRLAIGNLVVDSARGSPSFFDSVVDAHNLTVRNNNGSSLLVEGGTLRVRDSVLLDGTACGIVGRAGATVNATNATVRGHPGGAVCGDNLTADFFLSDLAGRGLDINVSGSSAVGIWSTLLTGSWTLDGAAVLTRGWRLTVSVTLANPALLPAIVVAVSDIFNHRTSSSPNATGVVSGLPYFVEWQETATLHTEFGPYTASATLDPLRSSETVDMNRDRLVQLSLDDTYAPVVSIASPQDGEIFPDGQVDFSFGATDVGTGVRLLTYRFGAGTPVTVEGAQGTHTLQRGLVDGAHSITVFAQDFAGNTAEATVNFTVDTIAPLISINSPRGSPFATNGLSVVVQVGFDADVVRVTIAGRDATIYRGTANMTVDLPEGTTVVEVRATDRAGNVGVGSVTVVADRTAPPLEVSNRQDPNVTVESFVVVRGTSEPGAVVFVQGVPVETANGTFEALVRLDVGENRIDIRARDSLGNQNVTSLVVHRGVTAPSTVLDVVFAAAGVILLATAAALLVVTMRREYREMEPERKRQRYLGGGRR